MNPNSNPFLLFCPYLPLTRPLRFDGWCVLPASQYTGPWLSPEFESLATTFLSSFQDANGVRIAKPALVVRESTGADGVLPSHDEILALQLALHFATIDGNADQRSDNAGWFTATTNNSELFIWPIDIGGGQIAITRGLLVSVVEGGHRISENLIIRAPLELHMPMGVNLDEEVLHASYQAFLGTGLSNELTLSLRNTTRWIAKAWRNTQDLGWDDRMIMLKTAFEALTTDSSAAGGANALHWIYQEFKELRHPSVLGTQHMLWSPTERRSRIRKWKDRRGREHVDKLTNLEHWYCSFAGARNTIIHDGVIPSLAYEASGSAYQGHYFHVGERLLRETMKILFDGQGYPDLWRTSLARSISRAMDEMGLDPEDDSA
jgi:hypothetical protein